MDHNATGSSGATIAILAAACTAALLGACSSVDPAVERGLEELPPALPRITLPPAPTSTPESAPVDSPPGASPSTVPPTASPTPDAFSALTTGAPWLLYCGSDGHAALMAIRGTGRYRSEMRCFSPAQVSGAAGFAVDADGLVQFPSGRTGRRLCCELMGWSADGNLALLRNNGLIGDRSELLTYDIAQDRIRQVVVSSYALAPVGISPDGGWIVYLESDPRHGLAPYRQPPAQLMAVSSDGTRTRELYGVYDAELITNSVLDWISDSELLIARADHPCNLEPERLELLYANLSSGAVRHLFDRHSYAAVDPHSRTVMLEELPRGACSDAPQRGRLMRMSAADGWTPHPVALPASWGDDWAISRIEWHPELRQFSVRVGENQGGAPLHLVRMDAAGTIVGEFPMQLAQIVSTARLFPSPDGLWIVVSASAPHGTRLYDRAGQFVRALEDADGLLSYGVAQAVWLPDGSAVYLSMPEAQGIVRAAAAEGWQPALVEPDADYRSWMTLVYQPERPYLPACGDRYTRLRSGDRVYVSFEPPLASRLRSRPGRYESVVGLMQPGERGEILRGPICGDQYIWWYVQPDEQEIAGWIAEGNAAGAWLLPVDPGE